MVLQIFNVLTDQLSSVRVDLHIDSLSLKLFGNVNPQGYGVHELRIYIGKRITRTRHQGLTRCSALP